MSYIPNSDADFDEWQKNFLTHVEKGSSAWNIPNASVDALKALQTQWDTDYAAGGKHVDRTSSQQLKKTQTRDLYEKDIRGFVQEHIAFNSLITDDERRAMKVTVREEGHEARPPITTSPTVRATPLGGGRIKLECRVESDSSRTSMHPDADIVELRYSLDDPAPESPAQATNGFNSSRSNWSLQIDILEQGKRFYGFARWANTGDESKSGPWSERFQVIVA